MRRLGAVAGLALLVGGCATAGAPGDTPSGPAAASRPAPSGPAAARTPSPREELAARHRAEAERLEREGDLRRALDQWKIAMLVNKDDAAAREGRARLEGRIEQGVSQRINEGRAALQRGSHVEARRRFLAALAMDPFNRTAFDALQNEVREVESISYTVRAGDTLASIAQRYYGDRSRSEVIWETNQLPSNPRLVAGTTLKIPEIPGVPFARAEPRRDPLPPVAALPPAAGATPPPSPGTAPSRSEAVREEAAPPEVNPLLADAREALERNEYSSALAGWTGCSPARRRTVRGRTSGRSRSTATARRSSTSASTTSPIAPSLSSQRCSRDTRTPRGSSSRPAPAPSTSTTARASSSTATRSFARPSASGRSCWNSTPPTPTPRRTSSRPSDS